MRIVRVDLVGTTDGSGNATIKVPLPFTGAWYNVKFPLSLSAPAEWAVLISGTPFTYGRGRRVTLGPELIQDGETVTISVTSGPPNAAISGSMNGSAGFPEEILASYTPQPNTIALDATAQRRALVTSATNPFTVPGNGIAQTRSVNIQGGIVAIRLLAQHALPLLGATISYRVIGDQTSNVYWGDPVTGQAKQPANLAEPLTIAVDPELDTSVTISATGLTGAGTWIVTVAGLTVTEVFEIRNQEPLSVQSSTGAGLTAQSSVGLQGVALTINTDFTILAGVANQKIYLYAVHLMTNSSAFTSIELWDGPSASGSLIGVLANDGTAVGAVPLMWDGHGRPGTAGNGLVGKPTNMSAGASIWGAVGLSQV